jgi:hypothetical protein
MNGDKKTSMYAPPYERMYLPTYLSAVSCNDATIACMTGNRPCLIWYCCCLWHACDDGNLPAGIICTNMQIMHILVLHTGKWLKVLGHTQQLQGMHPLRQAGTGLQPATPPVSSGCTHLPTPPVDNDVCGGEPPWLDVVWLLHPLGLDMLLLPEA